MAFRILIVDDLEDTAVSMAYLLESLGHTVKYTTKSSTALALARQFLPHIAFLDIGMLELDGWALCTQLKAEPSLEGLRCYAITGYGREGDERKSLAAGFDRHFTKPFSIDQLKVVLRG
jgi:CheY-like chemotaxis protein